ncbi:hypothetical protein [Kordiimonas gwangyangensis]|nr:hypothetical protein [Kordiimonas gwangyangensis]
MKFTKNDTKTLIIVILAVLIVGGLLWVGDEYDVPVLKDLHEAFGG